MKLSYIDLVNGFNDWCYDHSLDTRAQIVFFKILHLMNKSHWQEWTEVSNLRLMDLSGFANEATFIKHRDSLIELGFFEYKKGKKGQPNKYKLVEENFTKQKLKNTIKYTSQNYSTNNSISNSKNNSINNSTSYRHNKIKDEDKDEDINNITRINTRNIIAQNDKIIHEPKNETSENIFIKVPLISGEEYPITHDLIEEYRVLYPSVDIEQEMRKIRAWALSNPQKRKTNRGVLRFVNNWLSKEQDRGSSSSYQNVYNTSKFDNKAVFGKVGESNYGNSNYNEYPE